jgi:hypothetical protein
MLRCKKCRRKNNVRNSVIRANKNRLEEILKETEMKLEQFKKRKEKIEEMLKEEEPDMAVLQVYPFLLNNQNRGSMHGFLTRRAVSQRKERK